MTIDPTGSDVGTTGAAASDPTRKPTQVGNATDALGRDAFLKLLVTQLQHQNPLEPQPDGEFLAQLAQFSSLESLQDIKQDMSALRQLFQAGLTAAGTTPIEGGA
jgi:flagellar basal-body rod modification protein FlgD